MKLYQHFNCKFEALGVEIEGWCSYEKRSAIPILWGTGCKKISKKSNRFCAFLKKPKMQKMRKKFWKCIFSKFDKFASLKPWFQVVSVPKISLISVSRAELSTQQNPPKLIFQFLLYLLNRLSYAKNKNCFE